MWVIILLTSEMIFLCLMLINFLIPIPETAYYYVFSTIVQSEAAVFGVLIVILTFSLQFVSNKYQINTLEIIENSRELKNFTGLVVFSITISIIALILIKAQDILFFSVASLSIGSAFYFFISLYPIFKYMVKLSSLSSIANILISDLPETEEEIFKWEGKLKDLINSVLKSSDSIESKILFLSKILAIFEEKLPTISKDFSRRHMGESVTNVLLQTIEPFVETHNEIIVNSLVPKISEIISKVSTNSSKSFFTNLLIICSENKFEKGIQFIFNDCLLNTLRGDNKCKLTPITALEILDGVYEIIKETLESLKHQVSHSIDPIFLNNVFNFIISTLNDSQIDDSVKRKLLKISIKTLLSFAEFAIYLDRSVVNKSRGYLINKRNIEISIRVLSYDYGENLLKFVKDNPIMLCNDRDLSQLIKKMNSNISRILRPSYTSMMKRILGELYKLLETRCNQTK